jgi:tRNA G18 (ribose-2'-O)-methylase SpoU
VRLVAQVERSAEAGLVSPSFPSAPSSRLRLLLDNWRSNFNVGAAFRTADGAGIGQIYLCGITPTPESQRKLAKTALGAEQTVAWSYRPNAVQLTAHLLGEGAELWVLERNAKSTALFDIMSLPEQKLVVLAAGNEVVGVDPALVAMADRVVSLPMMGSKGSLNVAVALSVATYWLRARELANHDADG